MGSLVLPAICEFVPFSCYDSALDCIRAQTEDCSVTEVSITKNLTLLERNYKEEPGVQHVGFYIEGARYFCEENGLPYTGKVRIDQIVTKMLEVDTKSTPAILDIVLPILADYKLDEIEFPT
ncbi:MAG: hypothetical protein V4690_00135 [Patescibacteria group bacterium]